MREKLMRFMMGRCGVDRLSKDLMTVSFILLVISMITRVQIVEIFAVLLLFITYMRVFSKNLNKRYNENMAYLNYVNKIKYEFSKVKFRYKQGKTHHIYRCPKCKQKIRVPRGKGKISIRCQTCGTEFVKKS